MVAIGKAPMPSVENDSFSCPPKHTLEKKFEEEEVAETAPAAAIAALVRSSLCDCAEAEAKLVGRAMKGRSYAALSNPYTAFTSGAASLSMYGSRSLARTVLPITV